MWAERVIGTYLHGAFEHPGVCEAVFGSQAAGSGSKGRSLSTAWSAWFDQHQRHFEELDLCLNTREQRSAHGRRCLIARHVGLRRSGRFVVADLRGPHRVLTTSVRHGGQVDHLRHLLNHQSCEGTAHLERHRLMTEAGLDAYHDRACAEASLPPESTAVMGTAANMNYVAVTKEHDQRRHRHCGGHGRRGGQRHGGRRTRELA